MSLVADTNQTIDSNSPKTIRKTVRTARRNLSLAQQKQSSILAAKSALEKLKQLKAAKVALYLTNDGELDTAPLIEMLWQLGIQVYLPRLHPFSAGNLIFLQYEPKSALEMGMGGGYYDRTLANWQATGKPLPIGYAHDCQQVSKLASQLWDIPLPFIITPSKNYSFG